MDVAFIAYAALSGVNLLAVASCLPMLRRRRVRRPMHRIAKTARRLWLSDAALRRAAIEERDEFRAEVARIAGGDDLSPAQAAAVLLIVRDLPGVADINVTTNGHGAQQIVRIANAKTGDGWELA